MGRREPWSPVRSIRSTFRSTIPESAVMCSHGCLRLSLWSSNNAFEEGPGSVTASSAVEYDGIAMENNDINRTWEQNHGRQLRRRRVMAVPPRLAGTPPRWECTAVATPAIVRRGRPEYKHSPSGVASAGEHTCV